MPTPVFNARVELTSATEIAVGTYDIGANVLDGNGIFSALDIQIGDVVFIDTFASISAPATISRYQVTVINSVNPFTINMRIVYDDTGSSIDLNEVIGAYGFVCRGSDKELSYHAAPSLQSVPDYLIQYSRNYDSYIRINDLLSSVDSSAVQGTFTNMTGSSIAIGSPVSGNASGNIEDVDVTSEALSKNFLGVTSVSIPHSSSGNVVLSGLIKNISTSIDVGEAIYVSKSGNLTSTPPEIGVGGFVAGDFVIQVGKITKNSDNPSNKDLLIAPVLIGQL